ncbi:response regulator transcription factor [Luteimonas sp. MC1572]|uniref:response regulator transcription factor n=1 Tax=Luteimonas sp. MC1572 TaxID=2799325 RepID=UPI0018F0E51A|nr:response regulator transcription factor [Luteimonas sp. MC1572]MBJ6982669.1 response regulator transcription factor [Luteimonas sp. MC1572]QQO03912.1 response regulator transcription factor [Luteimonas sp. MC1572]
MHLPALRILVVEDNPVLRGNLEAMFADSGIAASFAADGLSGLQAALADPPDVLVLDLGLPGLDGLRVCERLRAQADRHIPVLMLTARDALDDRLLGFRSGADDYLVKPFAGAELLARCLALSQRHRAGTPHVLRIGSLGIDRRSGVVQREGRTLHLQQTAHQLLLALAEAWPRTLTRSELVEHIWGDAPPDSDPLRTHLYMLRQALDRPFAVPMLKTVHGVGFRLEADT